MSRVWLHHHTVDGVFLFSIWLNLFHLLLYSQVFLLCKQLLFGLKKKKKEEKVCLKMNTHSPSDTHFPFKERSAEQEMLTHLSSVCFPLCCLYFSEWNRNATRMCRRMLINETAFIKMPRRASLTSCYLCRSNWLQIQTLQSAVTCSYVHVWWLCGNAGNCAYPLHQFVTCSVHTA